jgi:predicted nucleic acid-binding protein
MMIADTSVWIEFLRGARPYMEVLKPLIEDRRLYTVECIFGEILQGARSKREIDIVLAYWNFLPKANEEQIWLTAGQLSAKEKLFSRGLGLIDLAILAAARKSHLKIWTLDKKLLGQLAPAERFEPPQLK